MSSLGDDIAAARQSGQTDEYLINAYKAYDPAKAVDIDAAIQGGMQPGHVLDALSAYDAQYGGHIENKGALTKAGGALQEGVAAELRGIGNTAKQTIGEGAVSGIFRSLGNTVAPSGYQPASDGLGDTHKSLVDRAGYLPRSVVEAAPGLATDMAAGAVGARAGAAIGLFGGPFAEATVPAGAALGGLIGFGGSYLLRSYGNDAQRAAQARTGDPEAVPNGEDKTRALLAGTANAALSRVGVKAGIGSSVSRAGESMLIPTAQGMTKAMVVDAGTGVASDALNTTLLDRQNPTDDPNGLILAGAQGAATGAGLRSVTTAGDTNSVRKFAHIDPEHAAALTDRYVGADLSSQAASYKEMKAVDRHLGLEADHWEERAQPQIDTLSVESNHTDDTGLIVGKVRARLASGGVVEPEVLKTLEERLGDYFEGDNLVRTLHLQNTQNQLKALGNFRDGPNGTGTFGGGLADTDFARNVLSPFGGLGKYGPRALVADYELKHLLPSLPIPHELATGIGAAQLGTYAAFKAFDKALRSDNPLAEYNRYFAQESNAAPNEPDRPNFGTLGTLARSTLVKQKYTGQRTIDTKSADMARGAAARSRLRRP